MKLLNLKAWIFAVLVCGAAMPCFGTEHGVTGYPIGIETVMTGMQPAPHTTFLYSFGTSYVANEAVGADGHPVLSNLHLSVESVALRVAHNWGIRFAGGTVGSWMALPAIRESMQTPGGKMAGSGIANIAFTPMNVSYSSAKVHWYYELGYSTPAPKYDENASLNIGQHYQSLLPAIGATYLSGDGSQEISSRVTYCVNGKNSSNQYRSGQEIVWEFNADRRTGPHGLTFGVNGAYYGQLTDDRQNGTKFQDGNRGRTLLLGPQVHIPITKRIDLVCKYYHESRVLNRTRGDALWFETMFPLQHRKAGR
jgi:hypothetical protein